MLKVLLKRQFSGLFYTLTTNPKTKKRMSTVSIILIGFLFLICFVSVGFAFVGVGEALSALIFAGYKWLYYAIITLVATLVGTFGSVFTTYSLLFVGKDNELLLSLPIKPRDIVLSRLVSVYVSSFIYSNVCLMPAIVVGLVKSQGKIAVFEIIADVLIAFILPLFITFLTCLLGYLVAITSSRIKNKSFFVVLFSLFFFFLYYFVYFKAKSVLDSIVTNIDGTKSIVKKYLFFFSGIGEGMSGNILMFLIVSAIIAVLFCISIMLISYSFTKLITTNKGGVKTEYKSEKTKAEKIKIALLKRELSHYLNSPTYLLNSGLGVVLILLGCVILIIKRETFLTQILALAEGVPAFKSILPVLGMAIVLFIVAMDGVSTSSISIEGKSIWILRSLPIKSEDILDVKINLHILVNSIPAVIGNVVIGLLFGFDVLTIVETVSCSWLFVWLSAEYGLLYDLARPILDWTNEAVPVKQNLSVLFSMLTGWITVVLVGLGGFFLSKFIDMRIYLAIIVAVFGIAVLLLEKLIKTHGVKQFEKI